MKNLTEPPIPYSPKVVTSTGIMQFTYKDEYARQQVIIRNFEENRQLTRRQKDDKLSKLFSNKRLLRHHIKTSFPAWGPIDFLDNSSIQVVYRDLNSLYIEIFYKNQSLVDFDTMLDVYTIAMLQKALLHVLEITDTNQALRCNGSIYSYINAVTIQRVNAVIEEMNRSSLAQHRHSLMDLIMSFAGIHPRLPDLFYPYELEVLSLD